MIGHYVDELQCNLHVTSVTLLVSKAYMLRSTMPSEKKPEKEESKESPGL